MKTNKRPHQELKIADNTKNRITSKTVFEAKNSKPNLKHDNTKNSRLLTIPNIAAFPKLFSRLKNHYELTKLLSRLLKNNPRAPFRGRQGCDCLFIN